LKDAEPYYSGSADAVERFSRIFSRYFFAKSNHYVRKMKLCILPAAAFETAESEDQGG
jgi:hypothetical protein